jgi:hypothetical protein
MKREREESRIDDSQLVRDEELELVTGGALIRPSDEAIRVNERIAAARGLQLFAGIKAAPVGLGCPRGHQAKGSRRPLPQAAGDRALLAAALQVSAT